MAMQKPGAYILLTIILISLGLLFFIISFATPHWLENDSTSLRKVERVGLWEACFKHWTYYKDTTLKEYDGCWSLLSSDFERIRRYILPSWLQGVQAVLCITLIMELAAVLILITMLLGILPIKYLAAGLVVCGIMSIVSGLLSGICMIVFYVNSLNDLEWFDNNEKHNQAFAFWLQLPSAFLVCGAGITSFVAFIKARSRDDSDGYR